MTRKQAILTLLGAPAAVSAAPPVVTPLPLELDQPFLPPGSVSYGVLSDQEITLWNRPSALHVNLADPDTKSQGVCALTVSYQGQSKSFSAKEIWDALPEVK